MATLLCFAQSSSSAPVGVLRACSAGCGVLGAGKPFVRRELAQDIVKHKGRYPVRLSMRGLRDASAAPG
jgi:hypothetical protein